MINPHGTSTPVGDKRETEAIWTAFGEPYARHPDLGDQVDDGPHDGRGRSVRGPRHGPVRVPRQIAPGTLNYREPDPECNLNIATEAIEKPLRYALSNNIGLGGHNSALIFKHYAGD